VFALIFATNAGLASLARRFRFYTLI
jgi:hypothetical protein